MERLHPSTDRITATELIAGSPTRQAVLLHHRYLELPAIDLHKEREHALER